MKPFHHFFKSPEGQEEKRPKLLLLHGFTGGQKSYDAVRAELPASYDCLAPLLLGHFSRQEFPPTFESQPDLSSHEASFEGEIARLAQVVVNHSFSPCHLVGYSMGARLGLGLVLRYPELFCRATLIAVHPGLAHEAERKQRRKDDQIWVDLLMNKGIEAFASAWEQRELFATERGIHAEARKEWQNERRKHEASQLASALQVLGLGEMPCYRAELSKLKINVHLVVGALDHKFVRVAKAMKDDFLNLSLSIVPEAGHNLLLEAPAIVASYLMEGEKMSKLLPSYVAVTGYEDIVYEKAEGIAKITINRPEVRNAFRPKTIQEMQHAFQDARDDENVGVVILTGKGPHAFCSGGDQKVRGDSGYLDSSGVPRLNVLDLQRQIRTLPKPVVAMVAGYAIGGGHVLHLVCDLTIAADNAIFGQTGPRVGSFDGGFGASYLARVVGQKKAREIWFLCRQYSAKEALDMGLVNHVVPLEQLELETVKWCNEMLDLSPLALRVLKASFNADCDGQAGLQELAGNATLLFYMTEEGREGKEAFLERRKPNFKKFRRLP